MAVWEVPALAPRLVHDQQDRVKAFGDGQAYAGLAPQARPFSTSGPGHRRPLRDAQVPAEVTGSVAALVA